MLTCSDLGKQYCIILPILHNTTNNSNKPKVSDRKKLMAQFWAWEEVIYTQDSELVEASLVNQQNKFCV